MTELLVFWRLPSGIQCVVAGRIDDWELRVVRGETVLLSERFRDPITLMDRARALRARFEAVA